jgi:hypothetical protein
MTHEPDSPERDPALDAAWREHSTEMPSAALDASILAAAHRAVGSAPKDAGKAAAEATSPQRWWMPLAAAATIGAIALGILQTMPQQDNATTPAATDAPARAPERASDAPSAPRDELQAASRKQAPAAVTVPAVPPAPASAPAKPAAKNIAPAAQIAASPAPQPFPAEKKAESAESDFKDRARMTAKLASAPEAAPTAPAPMTSGAVALGKNVARQDADAAPAVDVDAWIARIRKLHDDGKLADAAKELVAMRAAVPDADARLPRELRAWAASVKP